MHDFYFCLFQTCHGQSDVLKTLWSYRRAIVFYAVLLLIGWLVGEYVQRETLSEDGTHTKALMSGMILGALAFYVIGAAIPFVPAAEIGFALLVVFGAEAVPLVYLGMVGALTLSFTIARLLPTSQLAAWLNWLGFPRAATLIRTINEIPWEERNASLLEKVPPGFARTLCRNRYIALALLINLPGNTLLGGGGGIAFAAGASGAYSAAGFIATILIAVAPIPLFFLAM